MAPDVFSVSPDWLETTLKKLTLITAVFCAFFLVSATAKAQQFDIAFGYGTTTGQSATDALTDVNHTPQNVGGGGYPAFSGDFLFKNNFGIGAEAAWRAHQNLDLFLQPYRPILYDFNAVLAPPLGKKAQADFQGGIGWESIRFYTPFFNNCNGFNCTNFTSSNHFLGHVGAGLRYYVTNSVFIMPEAHFYFVRNNIEFSGPRISRYGVSIGYSFKNQE
jgi:hypothetical protein